jgi:hypothetical protein
VVVINFLNKANAADVRVYQLLNDKFSLFHGVFGASDEVLGSIESGVDFEQRIAGIYQNCRTTDQIELAFNELQSELESQISAAMNQTRQHLLENFDKEVHEKLRINLEESKEYLSKYEVWLWNITRFFLNDDADFAADDHSFTLINNPFPEAKIHPGPYRIGKNFEDANIYRISHPLAERIIEKCKSYNLPVKELIFDYTGMHQKITVLQSLVGKSGWLLAHGLSVSTFETEDYVLLAANTDDGIVLDNDQCKRLFSIHATESGTDVALDHNQKNTLTDNLATQKNAIIEEIGIRNVNYFDIELEKLDKWGDDRRNSLKVVLKEYDEQIKETKKQARLAPNLPEKLKMEKDRKKLETERDTAWREYDGAAKEIEQSKDQLIDGIEKRLNQNLKEEDLFLIRWQIV